MDRSFVVLCLVLGLGMTVVSYPDGALSFFLVAFLSIPAVYLMRRYTDEKEFVTGIFLVALFLRILLGVIIHIFDQRLVFGPDAMSYHRLGTRLMEIWSGMPVPDDMTTRIVLDPYDSGWGMNYIVAPIYMIFGPSILVAQSFCGFIGALTTPMVYFCAEKIFNNKRVAKISAVLIAVFPSFVIWSSQLLKDGLIIFLLITVMTIVLQLQKKINYTLIVILILCLLGIMSLRFYIFYMVVISVAGSFLIGLGSSVKSMVRNAAVVILLGLALTYLGVIKNATSNFDEYADLERIQYSREALQREADSAFGQDLDVSTTAGAISAVPVGFLYLMMAPFPWQVQKFSQVLIVPEIFAWWCLIPILFIGLWYTLKNKLRASIPVLLFSLMLTISYSIFQGNVGMAYRQRTQIQVFLFMFIAVGITVLLEHRENKKTQLRLGEENLKRILKARHAET